MPYSQMLRELFPEITLHAEDLLLLDSFQIKYLPYRVAAKEFATLLSEYPVVHRFMVNKYPPIASFLTRLLVENKPAGESHQIMDHCEEALWGIADLILYNKHPELYDRNIQIHWDISEISSITSLEGKIVADVGAGSGRIAFLVAQHVQAVFALEPLNSFRSFMKEKAVKQDMHNLFVMDGTLDSVALPDDSLDVLITSNAIGWKLGAELKEIERVVKPGGHAIHLLQAEPKHEDLYMDTLTSAPWKYLFIRDLVENVVKIKYY
jgi:hypothetical protein